MVLQIVPIFCLSPTHYLKLSHWPSIRRDVCMLGHSRNQPRNGLWPRQGVMVRAIESASEGRICLIARLRGITQSGLIRTQICMYHLHVRKHNNLSMRHLRCQHISPPKGPEIVGPDPWKSCICRVISIDERQHYASRLAWITGRY